MSTLQGTLVVTGASGFIGSALIQAAHTRGWKVEAWSRTRPHDLPTGVAWRTYDLSAPPPPLPDDLAAAIHCAHDMGTPSPVLFERNLQASLQLREATLRHPSARFAYLSSQSAHPGALSFYGKSKLAVEKVMDSPRDLIIRSGFVIGSGGLYSRIRESLRKLPVTPLFYGGHQPIHTVWIGDLVEITLQAVEQNVSGAVTVGCLPAVTIREFYRLILAGDGLKKPGVPIPGALALVMLRLTEKLGLQLPVTSENLLGLKALANFDQEIARSPISHRSLSTEEAIARAAGKT